MSLLSKVILDLGLTAGLLQYCYNILMTLQFAFSFPFPFPIYFYEYVELCELLLDSFRDILP